MSARIDISLAQPIAADPYGDNPRTGRLVIELQAASAGAGCLSVDCWEASGTDRVSAGGKSALRRRAFGRALSSSRAP